MNYLATLADEAGMARQGDGDGDRVAKQARPVTAKTRRSTRYHIAREFLDDWKKRCTRVWRGSFYL